MVSESEVRSRCRALFAQLRGHSVYLEQGQAETPLSARLDGLESELERAELRIAVIALPPIEASAAMSALPVQDSGSLVLSSMQHAGLLEIESRAGGIVMQGADGQRFGISSAAKLADALRKVPGFADWQPVDLERLIPQTAQGREIRLLVPASWQIVVESAAVRDHIRQSAHLILLLVPSSGCNLDVACGFLEDLCNPSAMILPIVDSERPEASIRQATGRLPCGLVEPPLRTRDEGLRALVDPGSDVAALLRSASVLHRLSAVAAMLHDRYETTIQQIQIRLKRDARMERTFEDPSRKVLLRGELDAIRTRITEDMGALLDALKEANRKSALRDGSIQRPLQKLLDGIGADDIAREEGVKNVRLALSDELARDLRRCLRKTLKQRLQEDLVLVRDAVDDLRSRIENRLVRLECANLSLAVTPAEEDALWAPVSDILDPDIKYRGELARRGFLQRLGEGRRVVFVLLMTLSLVGGFMGFNMRQAGIIGVVFLVVFLGAVSFTYRRWKREDAEAIDSELDKIRESIGQEASRIIHDAQREKLGRLQGELDEVRRKLIQGVDSTLRDLQSRSESHAAEDRRDIRARGKALEQRSRDFQSRLQSLQRGSDDLRKLASDVLSALRGAVSARRASLSG